MQEEVKFTTSVFEVRGERWARVDRDTNAFFHFSHKSEDRFSGYLQ